MRTILVALLGLCLHTSATAQSCLPNGITFNTQAQINSFHANYPGCTSIAGNVTIDPQPSGNITNLNGLSGLTFIGGDLTIAHSSSLNNLSGLSSLDSIGGSLSIFNTWGLNSLSALGALKAIHGNFIFYDNHGFTNLSSLTALSEVRGNVDIYVNPLLNNLNGLNALTYIGGSLRIADNVLLSNLNGLNNLKTVVGDVTIGGSTWQTNAALTSLSGLDNLTTVGGGLIVSNNPVLQDLEGLNKVNALHNLFVYDNQKLTSLAGLGALNSVQQNIRIIDNPLLTNLGFLENIAVCDAYLEIGGNTALSSLSALQNITTLKNGFKISGSPAITNLADLVNVNTLIGELTIENMDGLSNLQGLQNINITNGPFGSSISIVDNALLNNLSGLNPSSTSVQFLYINGNASLTDLQGLENFVISGQISLINNPLLTSLNGLQGLNSINGSLILDGNPSLQSLSGLNNLASLGTLSLANNNNLSNLGGLGNLASLGKLILSGSTNNIFTLNGLTGLNTISDLTLVNLTGLKNLAGLENIAVKGNVYIEQNASLENLNGMQGSTILNQLYLSQNPALTSLTGLENVTTIWDGIRIFDNPLLADLNGLNNLKTLRHDVFIFGNSSLSDCSAYGLCLFINDPPQPDSVGVGSNAPGCNTLEEVTAFCTSSYVTVEVLEDQGASCFGGSPLADMPVRLSGGAQAILKPSDGSGLARFRYIDTAPFEIVLPQLSNHHWNICEARYLLSASDGRDSAHVRLFLSPKLPCPELDVKLTLPTNFRSCLVNSVVRVTAQNIGTVLAEGGKMAVVMPPVFELLNTNPLMSGQNGDTLYFEIGDLKPFEKALIIMTVKTKCDTFLMGQTLCLEAFAAMDNPCPPTGQAYSEIKLKAECIGGTTVRLSLKNIGNAPTQSWHEYKIIRNDLVEFNNAFSLNAQESLSFDFPAEGATWRMEATKFDDGTQTAVAIENCGGLTPGLITAFWLDHGPVEYDFDCRQVVQAYDPNRKTAVPTGVGFENIISTGHPIYYTIDFQNTGTDTAFRLQLLDQLSENLDLNTFKAEGASHPCSWELRGSKLEVLYAPIALPDSNANLAASQGYFSYSISPKQNLQEGAQIYNFAQIVFDFNWPIWTNWVSHRIGHLTVSVDEAQAQTSTWRVLGNPTHDVAIFRAESLVAGEKQFELFDASGGMLRSARFSGTEFEFRCDMLPEGLYFFRISDAAHQVFAGKIVIAE